MVVAEEMDKPTLKVSMSDSDSSTEEESEKSVDEAISSEEDNEDGSVSSNEEKESVKSEDENVSSNEEKESDISEDENVSSNEEKESDISEDENISSNHEKKDVLVTNEGWADSVAKILGSSKPKNKKTLVLSRAKKHSEIVKSEKEEKPSFEVIGESSEKKPGVKEVPSTEGASEPPAKKVKIEKPSIRLKPNVLEKDRERLLNKIATKGVVQLFNAVRNQQKTLEKDLDRNDLTEGKKEKILKKFDKRTFLDTLMGNSKSVVVDEQTKSFKNEVKHEDHTPKWNALRDDFMMGAKMKDWDKESVDE